ncbi:MAG: flagellar motor switch phosphatase FliY [Spirochaetales bacterium]|nr:flagellar motor switch phosphatase FliY [Spirochaetales bacterium]
MSDGSLSQDEIDALLQGSDSIDFGSDFNGNEGGGESLSEQEKQAIQQILASVTESQSSNLSMLASQTITIGKPEVDVKSRDQLMTELQKDLVEVKTDFIEGLKGEHVTLLTEQTAIKIAGSMLGQDGVVLNEMAFSTLGEAMSNIMGPALTAIGNKVNTTITTSPPTAQKIMKTGVSFPVGDNFLVVEYTVGIEGKSTRMTDIYSMGLAKELSSLLTRNEAGSSMSSDLDAFGLDSSDADSLFPPDALGGGSMNGGNQLNMNNSFASGKTNSPSVQSVQFPNLQSGISSQEQGNIGLLMDVYMEMTVELGRTKKLIKEILGIGEGTIIELDKLAGEPVDILVNHKLIAKGEVVVIDENFGVRVTEIVSPMERMGDLP